MLVNSERSHDREGTPIAAKINRDWKVASTEEAKKISEKDKTCDF